MRLKKMKIEKEFLYKELPCFVVKMGGESPVLSSWYCGYVGIPKTNKYFGKNYDEIPDNNIHGGLTFSAHAKTTLFAKNKPEYSEYYFVGFDCAHAGDNMINCNIDFVTEEIKKLVDNLL